VTAAATNAGLPAPSIRRRLASMLYDGILLIGIVFFGFLAPNIVLGVAANIVLPSGILMLYLLIVVATYFIWFWRREGRTLAMKTWKIQLVSADGTRPSLDQLLLRFLLAWPSTLLGIGLIWALFDRDRQFLHDRLSGTRLVFTG
jgi:uncharacterized RDD family membrane protein YckC